MSAAPPHGTPLRRRVTLAFLAVALSGVALVSIYVVLGLSRRIAEEIEVREDEVVSAARGLIATESARARDSVEAYARSDEMRLSILEPLERLAAGESEEDEVTLTERRNAVLANAARARGLDFLSLAEDSARGWTLIGCAHYPALVPNPAPELVRHAPARTTTAGFAYQLANDNPPRLVPALVAARALQSGATRLVLFGGVRLDGRRVHALAENARAAIALEAPGLPRPLRFGAEPGPDARPAREVELSALAGGLAEAEHGAGKSRLLVSANVERLAEIRRLFTTSALVAVLIATLVALAASAWLSRRITAPILELSRAAQEIGAGNLEVRLVPRSDDEVGALAQVFNQMTLELAESRVQLQRSERIAAWREIARRVAHEIKNPLFPIQMSMETLRKGFRNKHPALEDIVEESTRTVLEEVRALNRIVTEFSEFARLPAPKAEPCAVEAMLTHVHALYAEGGKTAGGAAVAVELLPLPELPRVQADREQIERALINLVKNAIEAMPERGGRVSLEARAESRGSRAGVSVSVKDDGAGISEELRAKIFTPYFTTKAQGTGLGLAIVERVVAEHQGAIDLESSVGQGTTFRLWLPAAT